MTEHNDRRRGDRRRVGAPMKRGASLQTKFALASACFLVLIIGLGMFGLRQIESVGAATREIRDVALPKIVAVGAVEQAASTHALMAKRRVQTSDFRELASIAKAMRAAETDFAIQLARLRTDLASAGEVPLIDRVQRHWNRYLASVEEVRRLAEQGDLRRAKARFGQQTETEVAEVSEVLNSLVISARQDSERLSEQVSREYDRARRLTLVAVAAGVLATLGTALWTARGVSLPLLRISSAMRRLTEGNQDAEIPNLTDRSDEIGVLARAATAFRTMMIATQCLAEDLDRERLRLKATVRNMPLGLCMFDREGGLMVWNDAFPALYNLPAWLMEPGRPQVDILRAIGTSCAAPLPEAFAEDALRIVATGTPEAAIWQLADARSVSSVIQPTPDGWMLIGEDVTDRVAAEDRIRRLARTDALTGLANRLAFGEAIEATIEHADEAAPAAILFIDLDRFKHINDTLGHPVGDELLRQVSGRLNWAVDEGDKVARLGGDEFAIIQRKPGQPDAALALGEAIIAQLTTPFQIEGHNVRIGGSVGIALVPGHGETSEEVQKNADLALYAVKENGKGHCRVFHPSMTEKQQALHELEQSLLDAIQSDAFVMHYQPLFDIAQGEVCGAEALIRWNHPTRGLVPPSDFIPLAEELGLIRSLGARALELSCAAAAEWPAHYRLALNLSPLQFLKGDIAEEVLSSLKAAGIDPGRVDLEITEGALMGSTDRVMETLHAFRSAGIRIALDDFGTGYSSLRYLHAFPFDRVKIDASFVGGLPQDEGAAAIIEAICGLCETFGIAVTAEGIETETQLDFVRKAGCTMGQGFLFAQPMPAPDFLGFANGDGPARLAGGRT